MGEITDLLPKFEDIASSLENGDFGRYYDLITPQLEKILERYKTGKEILSEEDTEAIYSHEMLDVIFDNIEYRKFNNQINSAYLVLGILSEISYWSESNKNPSEREMSPDCSLTNAFWHYIKANQKERAVSLFQLEYSKLDQASGTVQSIIHYLSPARSRTHTSSDILDI